MAAATENMPTLSVLTPSYNDARFLGDCIASVRAAAGIDAVQHIVVDDGSTDDTGAVLAAYSGICSHRLPFNQGASVALNVALHCARGDWCLILAADDMVTPSAYQDWRGAVIESPDANVIYSDLELFGAETGFYRVPAFDAARLRERNLLPGSAFVRRDLLLAVNGFDERLRSAQDWDFWVRADLAVGLRPVKVARPMVRYRRHATTRLHNESVRNQAAIRAHIRALLERAA